MPGGRAKIIAIRGSDPQNIVLETSSETTVGIRNSYPSGSFNLGGKTYRWILNPNHTPCRGCGRGSLCQLEGLDTLCGKYIRQQTPNQQHVQQNKKQTQLQRPAKQPTNNNQQNSRQQRNSQRMSPPSRDTNFGRPGRRAGHGTGTRDQQYSRPAYFGQIGRRFIPPRMRPQEWWPYPDGPVYYRDEFPPLQPHQPNHPRNSWAEPQYGQPRAPQPWFRRFYY